MPIVHTVIAEAASFESTVSTTMQGFSARYTRAILSISEMTIAVNMKPGFAGAMPYFVEYEVLNPDGSTKTIPMSSAGHWNKTFASDNVVRVVWAIETDDRTSATAICQLQQWE